MKSAVIRAENSKWNTPVAALLMATIREEKDAANLMELMTVDVTAMASTISEGARLT